MQDKDTVTKVLITERGDPYLSLEQALLEQYGYCPVRVAHAEIIDAVRQHSPKVLVLSFEQSGAELDSAQALRRDPELKSIGILATGMRGQISKEEVLSRGVNRLLWKPFSPDRFVNDIHTLSKVPPRYPVRFDVQLRPKRGGNGPIKGMSVNLSESGILFYCEGTMEVGHRMILEGSPPDGRFECDVVVVRQAVELGPGYYAVRFKMGSSTGRPILEKLDVGARTRG